jgi:two-component system cell cycle response regulator DivK
MHRVSEASLALAKHAELRYQAKILVAEDSPDAREMLRVLLERRGYTVVSASDGFEAVDVAIHTLPDLILIDLELPGLDGLSVATELRLHPSLEKIPIIVISGHDPESYRAAAMNAGCNDYLMKPIDFSLLDKVLHESIPQHFIQLRTA